MAEILDRASGHCLLGIRRFLWRAGMGADAELNFQFHFTPVFVDITAPLLLDIFKKAGIFEDVWNVDLKTFEGQRALFGKLSRPRRWLDIGQVRALRLL